ncbi:MAG: adenosylmethionine--8-amino-7-oxononanoate transaminase, partial [Actinomycetota bacterium]|nr:adenosylmethionine--8-amino-7-oxononanoate transaminase [Actinomycetota bacterium]
MREVLHPAAGEASQWAGELPELDRRHVWHPYGPMPGTGAPLPVTSAEGVRLRLADGRELVDGMASWWCAVHGYRHPILDAAAHDQLDRMAHVMFGGLTHEPAVRLAQRLVEMAPAGLEHVFFADSGSVSVEVAIKLCLQARPGRHRLLTVRGGYHGDTFGAMAVCDPVGGMHRLFTGALAEHVFADRPPAVLDDAYAEHLRALVIRHAGELAAVIVEPVVQGAGGLWFYDPRVLSLLRALCDEHGLFLVADEIATGFGRTGTLFACEHAGVVPDVLCLGKALTGGYLTLAATLCTARVADALEGEALMHGPTYIANPLACAVALASTGLLAQGGWREDVVRLERGLRGGLEPARALPGV